MPFVNISLFQGRTDAQKKAVAKRITEAMCEEWGLMPEHIWIRFDDTRMEDWFTGPDSAAEIKARRLASSGGD